MYLTVRDGLLLVPVTVTCRGHQIPVRDLVMDTGSAASLIASDAVAQVDIVPEPVNTLHIVRSLGGFEGVFSRRIDQLPVGPGALERFERDRLFGQRRRHLKNLLHSRDIVLWTRRLLD